MENVFVVTLDRECLCFGLRSLVRECMAAPGGPVRYSGYGSQESHNANAHEHADGQESSEEETDAQNYPGQEKRCRQENR
jgi:hypothetical protein